HMGSYTLQQLKKLSFDEIKELEAQRKMLNKNLIIVLEEEVNVEAIQTKYPIINWEVYTEDLRKYKKIIRVGDHTEVELKRLFKPDTDDLLELQRYMHDPLTWSELDTAKGLRLPEEDNDCMKIKTCEEIYLELGSTKLTNLTVEERLGFNVSLRMFTRSIIIQRHVDDLQLGVESYQKKLNLTKPDTYRLDLKRREAYTAYSNPRGFIYQNKDKKNRLMHIDELHKFSDDTLNDVWTALNDRLKGIRMKYLPQTIWRQSDRYKA
ncbi:hypothetical protein Tco_1375382, partial [Tanacetum coccineum]